MRLSVAVTPLLIITFFQPLSALTEMQETHPGYNTNYSILDFEIDDIPSITIDFTANLNPSTIEQASIHSNIPGDTPIALALEYQDDAMLHDPRIIVSFQEALLYGQIYELTISGNIEDVNGQTIDGNRNGISEGSPEDDIVIYFQTEESELQRIEIESSAINVAVAVYEQFNLLHPILIAGILSRSIMRNCKQTSRDT